MNANRLHALLILLDQDLHRTEIVDKLEQLYGNLQTATQNPQPVYHEQAGNSLKEALAAAQSSEIDELSPAWRQMIVEIGYDDCLGSALAIRLNDVFKQANVTPSLVLEEIHNCAEKLRRLQEAVQQGKSSLEALSIGSDVLSVGDCELGFMIPKDAIDQKLHNFAEECEEFDFIFGTFSETVTGSRQEYILKNISSSDLSVFLECLPPVAAAIAFATERIITGYKQLLEIRKLRSELRNQGLTDKALEKIDDHANSHMEKLIAEITAEIIKKYGEKHEKGRKNELHTSIKFALSKLANRIDRGFHIEIRVGQLPHQDSNTSDSDEDSDAQTIARLSKNLEYVRMIGSPMLSLPESESATHSKSDAKKAPKES